MKLLASISFLLVPIFLGAAVAPQNYEEVAAIVNRLESTTDMDLPLVEDVLALAAHKQYIDSLGKMFRDARTSSQRDAVVSFLIMAKSDFEEIFPVIEDYMLNDELALADDSRWPTRLLEKFAQIDFKPARKVALYYMHQGRNLLGRRYAMELLSRVGEARDAENVRDAGREIADGYQKQADAWRTAANRLAEKIEQRTASEQKKSP